MRAHFIFIATVLTAASPKQYHTEFPLLKHHPNEVSPEPVGRELFVERKTAIWLKRAI
jgi:hypothetical protein